MNDPYRETWVSRSLVALAGALVQDFVAVDLLDRLVTYGVELFAADAVGVLLGDAHDRLRVAAASSDDAALAELLASDDEDGPCVECFRGAVRVRVPDLAQVRSRWPEFTVAVDRAGAFRSVHALPLQLRGKAVGVLLLLHNAPGLLSDDDLALGQALADLTTIGLASEQAMHRGGVIIGQLRTALGDQVLIEQAKGVIAQDRGLDVDAASTLLCNYAHRHDQRLGELARQIVARELDPGALSPAGTSESGAVTALRRLLQHLE